MEILEELYKFYSPSGQEKDVLSWVALFLKKRGFDISWQEYDLGRFNLYAYRGETPFLIATHADVYYGGRPNQLTLKNGFLYGPGVVDVRGQIAALLDAVSRVEAPFALAFPKRRPVGLVPGILRRIANLKARWCLSLLSFP